MLLVREIRLRMMAFSLTFRAVSVARRGLTFSRALQVVTCHVHASRTSRSILRAAVSQILVIYMYKAPATKDLIPPKESQTYQVHRCLVPSRGAPKMRTGLRCSVICADYS